MPYSTRTTRTVKIISSDGRGPPRVETKTYTDGDEDDSGFSGGLDFGGFKSRFGNMKIGFGSGGGDSGHSGSHSRYSHTQRPSVVGRSSRREKKNPFAGYDTQSYDQIVKKCREEGCLFEDPEFEAEDSSIFFSRKPPRPFEWKRPNEICDDPQYVSAGASRFDVQQGELGDCWLLAAVASLTCNPHLLNKVIMPEQNFTDNYCGVFKFLFWHQGDWTEVVVDDRLPTYYGQLVFMHSTEKNEFWSALLEKAYAKLNGSYESLKGGSTSEAMEDFTGGVTESWDLGKNDPKLLNVLMKACDRGSLMGCSIDADPNQLEARLDNGLVMGHAYSVTAVKLVEIQTPRVSGKIPMMRVRNPWGNEAEWKGAWSDKSAEWSYIPESEKKDLGLTFEDDGEFWMSFEDWQKNFQKLEICNLGPDSLDEAEAAQGKKRWEMCAEVGEWISRVNAGGCRNYLETFSTNPQYRVSCTDPDDDEDNLCTVLVGLLQKDRRKKRKEGLDMLTIGYVIYKLKEDGSCGSGPLDQRFFKYNASCAKSPSFINMREICGRHKLEPGTYVIIPSTFEPNQEGRFLLRIFTEKANETSEMDEGTGIIDNQTKRWNEGHGSAQQPDPYANREPPPIGFDLMSKSDFSRPDPVPTFDFSKLFPNQPGPQGMPDPLRGYQPNTYGPGPGNTGYPPHGQYGAPQYQGGPGYQQMPAPGYPYDPQSQGAGYQQNQYYPNPPGPGYQPGMYPSGPPPAGYQPNQYYSQPGQNYTSPYPNQTGYPAPAGQGYPNYQSAPGTAQYGWASATGQGQPPQQQQYPYGQGEGMIQSQSASMYMSEPDGYPVYGGDYFRPTQVAGVASAPSHLAYQGPAAVKKEGPPMTEEDQAQGQALRESFKHIAGEDLEVDAFELQEILNTVFTKEFEFSGFSVDVCRSMVAMHDGDLSGKLGFDEFKQLWMDLRKWKAVFKQFDRDNSGKLSTYELRDAFHASGFRLSNRSLSAIIMRFSNKKGEVEFGDFVLCAIRLKSMLSTFANLDKEGHGVAAFDIDNQKKTPLLVCAQLRLAWTGRTACPSPSSSKSLSLFGLVRPKICTDDNVFIEEEQIITGRLRDFWEERIRTIGHKS